MLNVFDFHTLSEDIDTMERYHAPEDPDLHQEDIQDTTTDHHQHEQDYHVGDILQEDKPSGCIRMYCININGIKWDKDGGTWPTVCQAMEACNVDIVGIAELNHDVGRYELQHKLEQVCKETFKQHQLIMSTSKHKVCKTYKPGGTAAIACHDMKALVKSWSRDRMGRWTAIQFSGSEGQYLTFIMAYQVGKITKQGTNTAAAQQRASIIEESTALDILERLSPRQAFIRDLQQYIKASQQAGDAIILSGDFNETMSERQSGMATLAATCGLVDIFRLRLGTNTSPTTYQRGRKRLDYVLLSPSLIPAVKAAGYDPFGYRVVSDHRGYYIDFDANILCGFTPTKLAPASHREFQTTNPQQLRVYLQTKHRYLKFHNWYAQLQTLMENINSDNDTAEALDRDLQRSSRCAANACRFSYRSPWSPKFAQAWATINFYKLAKSHITNNHDYTMSIKRLQEKFPTLPTIIPTDPLLIQTKYRKAVTTLHQVRQEARALREIFYRKKWHYTRTWRRKAKHILLDVFRELK